MPVLDCALANDRQTKLRPSTPSHFSFAFTFQCSLAAYVNSNSTPSVPASRSAMRSAKYTEQIGVRGRARYSSNVRWRASSLFPVTDWRKSLADRSGLPQAAAKMWIKKTTNVNSFLVDMLRSSHFKALVVYHIRPLFAIATCISTCREQVALVYSRAVEPCFNAVFSHPLGAFSAATGARAWMGNGRVHNIRRETRK